MNATRKAVPSEKGQIELATLKSAVAQALEKKRRLGQYAVIWQNGKPVMVGEDAPEVDRKHS
ncbi:hypothetical protein A2G06_08425 [Geobacter anodireducens]|nr:hypothetical protein A2G06_08425 [Geobacter anodireducens]